MTETRLKKDDEPAASMIPPLPVGVVLHSLRMARALNEFPNLKEIVQWNKSLLRPIAPPMVPADDRRFRLSDLLWVVADLLPWYQMLHDLETWLGLYPEYKTRAFGKQLAADIFDRYAEIQFYHYLRVNSFTPGLNPKVATDERKNVDFEIQYSGRPYLIEVFVPRHSLDLEAEFEKGGAGYYDPGRGIGPKNQGQYSRVAVHIDHELRHHFSGVDPSAVAAPVVLAMNITYVYPEVMMGESLPPDVVLPQYIAGVLLYDTRKKLAGFYPNPAARLDADTVGFFSELIPRAWELAERDVGKHGNEGA